MIVGIDQSFTSTALVAYHKGIVAHTIVTSNKNDDIYTRAAHIASGVIAFVNAHKPTTVLIEGLAFGGTGNATRNLAGLQMHIICQLRAAGHSVEIVPPTTLKKFATGSGKASKVEMHAALPNPISTQLSGYKKTKGLYDVVDAYWLSTYKD